MEPQPRRPPAHPPGRRQRAGAKQRRCQAHVLAARAVAGGHRAAHAGHAVIATCQQQPLPDLMRHHRRRRISNSQLADCQTLILLPYSAPIVFAIPVLTAESPWFCIHSALMPPNSDCLYVHGCTPPPIEAVVRMPLAARCTSFASPYAYVTPSNLGTTLPASPSSLCHPHSIVSLVDPPAPRFHFCIKITDEGFWQGLDPCHLGH